MSDSFDHDSEGNVTDKFVRVPANAADMDAQDWNQARQSEVDQGVQPSVSNVAPNSMYIAPSDDQVAAAAAAVAMGPVQQVGVIATTQPAMMPPAPMLLESGFQRINAQTPARMGMGLPSTSLMDRSFTGLMGSNPSQQTRTLMAPSSTYGARLNRSSMPPPSAFEAAVGRPSSVRQNAPMYGVISSSVNPLNPYGFNYSQHTTPMMQTTYSPFGLGSLPSSYGYGYGPQHPQGVPNPLLSMFGGGPFGCAPTPEEYASMYYQHAHPTRMQTPAARNRVQTVAPSDRGSPSPELVPMSTKRKRGKRASKAQIAAEDAKIAQNQDSQPKAKRGRRATKIPVEDDEVEKSEEDAPAPKAKRGKKGAKGKVVLKLNPNSKAYRVAQAQKLLGTPSVPASRYGYEQGLVPIPERLPSIAEIEATFADDATQTSGDRTYGEDYGDEVDHMEIDPAHGGQLITENGFGQGASVYDGYIGRQNATSGAGRLHAPTPTRQQSSARASFLSQDFAADNEDEEDAEEPNSHDSSIIANYAGLTTAQKYGKFHEFFMSQFVGDRVVVQSFYRLGDSYRNQRVSEREYYKGIYMLIHLYGTEELVEHFKGLLPDGWLPDIFDWIHREVSSAVDVTRVLGDGGDGTMLEIGRRPRNGERKKKAPVNGFRAGDTNVPVHDEDADADAVTDTDANPDAPEAALPASAEDDNNDDPTSTHNVGSPQKSASVQPSTPLSEPPMSDYDEDEDGEEEDEDEESSGEEFVLGHDEFTGGRKKKKTKKDGSTKPRASQLHSSQIKHVGKVYETRRAILTREDRPYICALCDEDHRHPSDVAHHHGGSRKSVIEKGCWAKHGKPSGPDAEWDRHPSCHVTLSKINYTKVKNGFVILDQASLDKIEAAIEAGRKYKLQNPRPEVKRSGRKNDGTPRKARGKGKKTLKATPDAKKAVPQKKKKVVKAGADESE